MILRPYQRRALDDLYEWFGRHPNGNPIVDACVGAGKSVLIATLCREAIEQWPETRIVMTVASRELCQQNLHKLLAVWPEAPASLYSASLGARQLGGAVLYSTIGSIYKRAHQLGAVSLLLVDECHLIGSAETGMYRQLIADLTKYNPGMRVIGWTGTAFRGNGIWLTDQDEPIFHGIAAKITMRELLDSKYLSPLRSIATETQINTAGLGLQAGDYRVSELADVSDRESLVRAACAELVTLAAGRQRWLVYGVTIAHATHIRDALRDLGVVAEMVSATTPLPERDAIIKAFRAGRVRALVNVAVLTTGFDVPEVDCIALLRATRSPLLYTQICGRGMRIADGKQDCAWIDFTSTTATLGPVDQIKGRAKPRQRTSQGAPFRVCPQCGSHNATAALTCVDCGQAFPAPERINHMAHASAADVLSSELVTKVITYPVTDIRYARHTKPGAPDIIRADYFSGLRKVAAEWVCLDHPGFAGEKARRWWARRAPREFLPGSVSQALEWIRTGYVLRTPLEITVNESGRWPEIIGSTWDEQSTSGSEAGNAAARTAAPEVGGIQLHPMRELQPDNQDLQRVL